VSPVVKVGPKARPLPDDSNALPSSPWYPNVLGSQPGRRFSRTPPALKPMPMYPSRPLETMVTSNMYTPAPSGTGRSVRHDAAWLSSWPGPASSSRGGHG